MAPRQPTPPGVLGVTRGPTRREWRRALVLFVVGMVGLVLVLLFVHPQADLLPVGTAAPPIHLTSTAGQTVDAATSTAGRPYIVEFFESGCSHCQQVAASLCSEPVAVFAVDAAKESGATIDDYHRQYAPACSYPLLLDPQLTVSGAWGVTAVPTVYLIVHGKVDYAGTGLDGVGNLKAAVAKATGG